MSPALWYCPLCRAEGDEPWVQFCIHDGGRVRPVGERGSEWIGKVVADKYRVVRFIDEGGSAEVYEAERLATGKRVALKLLHRALDGASDRAHALFQEAQLASRVAHPNIVAIEDAGTLSGSAHFLVMELLHGKALSSVLARGPIPARTAVRYAMQACEGLAAAHARDVVHCDVKPGNIFLETLPGSSEPVVKILDLGLARALAPATAEAPVGALALAAGTPAYMSPEQIQGKPLGPAADIYSMGVTVYEMLLGVVPFDLGSYAKILCAHLEEPPPWPAALADRLGVPEGARDVVLRALAKAPGDRQGSMTELQHDLAGLVRHARGRRDAREKAVSAPPSRPAIASPVPSAVRPAAPPSEGVAASPDERADDDVQDSARRLGSGPRRVTPSRVRAPADGLPRIVPLADARGTDDEVVEIAPGVYWVGRRHGRLLECNAYLRVWKSGGTEVSLLVDPGPPKDLEVVTRKVAAVIGSMKRLDFVFLNHQDPDVAANAAPIQQANPRVRVLCSEDTFRLAQFYGLDPNRFVAVDDLCGGEIPLVTGHALELVPTPFCHFRGAVALYDRASRVLFSGDLFGGARATELVSSDRSWPGVASFHQIYMPSRRALALAVARIRRLDPAPTLIAPQHGALVTGDRVHALVDQVGRLEVGLDLLDVDTSTTALLAVANDIVTEYAELAGEQAARALVDFAADTSFSRVLAVDDAGVVVDFRVEPRHALDALARDALAALPVEKRGDLQRSIREIWKQYDGDRASSPPPAPSTT